MNRRSSICTFLAMATLIMGSAIAFAHGGVEHILGTVTAVTDNSITVDTTQHKSVTAITDAATTFTNKTAKASLKDLKVGDRVAVDAKKGAGDKLQAVSVKWGASSTMKMPADDKKMPAGHKMEKEHD